MTTAPVARQEGQRDQIEQDFVHVARLALSSGDVSAQGTLRRLAKRYRESHPSVAADLVGLLRDSPLRGASGTAVSTGQPVDVDSRIPLARIETNPLVVAEPILTEDLRFVVEQVLQEYKDPSRLAQAGLSPTRTLLFVGPPGVGKTLTARWMANSLDVPLVVLDLASIMSSFLGKTGVNVRRVMDYARQNRCVFLLDELDAVAKRRDDATEVGELKRLVTVLLQEIDRWPEGSLLIAATNHSELLDPAVWRRFEVVANFPSPSAEEAKAFIAELLPAEDTDPAIVNLLARLHSAASYSEIEKSVTQARRVAVVQNMSVIDALTNTARRAIMEMSAGDRRALALELHKGRSLSQRKVHELTGVSRDTLRKYTRLE